MNDIGCMMIGRIIKPYVDERSRWELKKAEVPGGERPTKTQLQRLYVRAARKLGHSQVDQRFHLELIRLSKAADYAEDRRVILAHSNSFLELRCGMSRSALGRQMRKHDGTTLTRTLSGNGHRFIARERAEENDGTIIEACGVSLEPLIAMLLAIVPALDAEDELKMRLEITKARIGRDRRRQRTALALLEAVPLERAAALEAESRALANDITRAFNSWQLGTLETLACKVGAIADEIDEIVAESAPANEPEWTPQVSTSEHLLPLQGPQIIESVVAIEEVAQESPPQDAPERPKWTPRQLKSTFPALAMYVTEPDPFWIDIDRGSARLANDLGIDNRCWSRAREAMGPEQRHVAIWLVAELLASGRIKTTAGQYFGGMLKKARCGQLDLDRSVWAHRQRSRPIAVV